MPIVDVMLDETTFLRAKSLAGARRQPLGEFLAQVCRQGVETANGDPTQTDLIGLLADEPQLLDAILCDVMASRDTFCLRRDDVND